MKSAVRGKLFVLRSEASKDWPAADYPGDLCSFNWRFGRQIVEDEMRRRIDRKRTQKGSR
jgi:hypothetical protein